MPVTVVTVAPLSTPATRTLEAWEAVTHASRLFLQTDKHPSAKPVLDAGLAYTSMDDLYESAPDFDALHRAVAERLLFGGDCVYAVPGAGAFESLSVLCALAAERGVTVKCLGGVSLSEAAFPMHPAGRRAFASGLAAPVEPGLPLYVEELDTQLRAGEVKLLLAEYYPDEWPVEWARLDAAGRFRTRRFPLCELDRQPSYDAGCALYVPAAPFSALRRYGYAELSGVVARLRAPDGCPWDREQTHESLRTALLEECYELLDAIDHGDSAALCEELGDVLLQVALHAEIASEQGSFTQRDVTTGLVEKLVYRHPHIFGNVRVNSSDEVLRNWDKLKKAEKHQQTQTEVLLSTPRNLPSLRFAQKIQKRAGDVGFDWNSASDAFFKIREETDELAAAMAGEGERSEEAGDLLFAVVNVLRLLKLDPELALRAATDKFIARFAEMERMASEEGHTLSQLPLSQQDLLWERAKTCRKQDKNS